MGQAGLEPATSASSVPRSPNYATDPCILCHCPRHIKPSALNARREATNIAAMATILRH